MENEGHKSNEKKMKQTYFVEAYLKLKFGKDNLLLTGVFFFLDAAGGIIFSLALMKISLVKRCNIFFFYVYKKCDKLGEFTFK